MKKVPALNPLVGIWYTNCELKNLSFSDFGAIFLTNSRTFCNYFSVQVLSQFINKWYPPPYNSFNRSWDPMQVMTPLLTIPIRLHNTSASSMEWVVRIMALLPYFTSWRIFHNCLLVSGSNPVVGSSKKMIFGSETRLIAMESLLFIPRGNSVIKIYL